MDNGLSTTQPGTPVAQLFTQTLFLFLIDQVSSNVSYNHYIETNPFNQPIEGSATSFVSEAMAKFMPSCNYSTSKKKPEDAEIKIDDLPAKVRSLLTGKGGPRKGELSNMINQVKERGGPP